MSLGISSSKSSSETSFGNSATTSAKNKSRGGNANVKIRNGADTVAASLGVSPAVLLLVGAVVLLVLLGLLFR